MKRARSTGVSATAMHEQVIEAWHTNNRINLLLLDRIPAQGLKCSLSTRGGRSVARQFAHLHNVRVWHLQGRAKSLSTGLKTFATSDEPTRIRLKRALVLSAQRVEAFLTDSLHGADGRRPFRKGAIVNLGYFISHESHHRGSILLTLKQSGHGLAKADAYAIWNWDKV